MTVAGDEPRRPVGPAESGGGSQRRVALATVGVADAFPLVAAVASARLACFPTDTVYGVGGALRPAVAEAVVAAKGRGEKPLQVVFPNRELLLAAVPLSALLADVAYRLLPGALTVVIPYPEGFTCPPPGVVEHESTVLFGLRRQVKRVETLGVRVPRWPEAARVLATLPFPLLASSANPSGGEPARRLEEVDPALLGACDLVLDGGEVEGRASTVVDFSLYEETGRWRVLRGGAVGEDAIAEMLSRKRDDLPAVSRRPGEGTMP